MAAVLQSKLVISLEDRASGPARGLKAQIEGLKRTLEQASQRPYRMAIDIAKKFHEQTRSSATAAAFGMQQLIQKTQEFKELEWGYQFAILPDYIKDGVLQLDKLQAKTAEVSKEARKLADELGVLPNDVMRARMETQKVGVGGSVGDAMMKTALHLRMGDSELPIDKGVHFLNAIWQSNRDLRRDEGRGSFGLDLNDDGTLANPAQQQRFDAFNEMWLKRFAARAAVAAADSPLSPTTLIEGMRQFAPQWAALGIRPEVALGALARGSSEGFGASEMGTAMKSFGNRLIRPTAEGLRSQAMLGMDPRKWVKGLGAADPIAATNRLNQLLGGQLSLGQGARQFNVELRQALIDAKKDGSTTTPEFQAKIVKMVSDRLGPTWAGKADDVVDAVTRATTVSTGQVDILAFISEARAKGMSVADMLVQLEGRHVSRHSGLFRFFDALVAQVDRLDKIGPDHMDHIVNARKSSAAGKIVALQGQWQQFLIRLGESPATLAVIDALATMLGYLNQVSPNVMALGIFAASGVVALGAIGIAFAGIAAASRVLLGPLAGILGLMLAAKRLPGIVGTTARAGAVGAPVLSSTAKPSSAIVPKGPMVGGLPSAAAAAGGSLPWFQRIASYAGIGFGAWQLYSAYGDKEASAIDRTANGAGGALAVGAGAKALGWLGFLGRAASLVPGGMFLPMLLPELIRSAPDAYDRLKGNIPDGETAAQRVAEDRVAEHYRRRSMAQRLKALAPDAPWGRYDGADMPAANAAQQVPQQVKSSMAEARAIMRAEDYTAEGQRIAESIANGIRAGAGAIADAIRTSVNETARRAVREQFSDGGLR